MGSAPTLSAICAILHAKLRSSTILNSAVERVEAVSAISLNRFHAVDESLIAKDGARVDASEAESVEIAYSMGMRLASRATMSTPWDAASAIVEIESGRCHVVP